MPAAVTSNPFQAALPGRTTGAAPLLTPYLPAPGTANGRSLAVFPGGGYGGLAPHEGRDYAAWYAQRGYTCFVVTYRLGTDGFRHPAMLEDAAAAVHTIRTRAAGWGLRPDAIGAIGSSAGGHLVASLMVHHRRFAPAAACRPDFGILCYPVISMIESCTHTGSRDNLLGAGATPDALEALSCERQVSADTPPCFLWHTTDDPGVPVQNSLLFMAALRRHGVPAELHAYVHGGHGLGLNTAYAWAAESLRFADDVLAARRPPA